MFKKIFCLLLLAHVLGDFYFQPNKLAEKKDKLYSSVIFHSLIYSLINLIIIIPLYNYYLLISVLINGILHVIIDSIKFFYKQKSNNKSTNFKKKDCNIFILDQIFHISVISIISLVMAYNYSVEINYEIV